MLSTDAATGSFSLYTLLSSSQGLRVIYGVTWIISGLFLLFVGVPSLYWITPSRRKVQKDGKGGRKWLPGGIGGLVVGFLALSSIATVIAMAIASRRTNVHLSSYGWFAVWLVTGLVGSALSGQMRIVSSLLTGLLGGLHFTLLFIAAVGIKRLVMRMVLAGMSSLLMTIPLFSPIQARWPLLSRIILVINLSVIGSSTFMDGLVLFIPSQGASHAWIDLWIWLFAPDQPSPSVVPGIYPPPDGLAPHNNGWHRSSTQNNTVLSNWSSSTFKGYLAAAILGAVLGSLFQAWFYRGVGESPDEKWNDYLGVYTGSNDQGDNRDVMLFPSSTRKGDFEPYESPWSRLADRWNGGKHRPAKYGQALRGDDPDVDGFTGRRPQSMQLLRPSSAMSRQVSSDSRAAIGRDGKHRPARFDPWQEDDEVEFSYNEDRKMMADDDGEISTLVDSEYVDLQKRKSVPASSIDAAIDRPSPRPQLALQRPPTYRTDEDSSRNSSSLALEGTDEARATRNNEDRDFEEWWRTRVVKN